jgi:hypothetical protein
MNRTEALTEIDRKILKLSIYSLPGPILTALALLGKYGEPDEIPFAFLTNAALTTAMLVVGLLVLVGTGVMIIKLGLQKAAALDEDKR